MKNKILFFVLLMIPIIAWTQKSKDTVIPLHNGSFIKGRVYHINDSIEKQTRDTIFLRKLFPLPVLTTVRTKWYSHFDTTQTNYTRESFIKTASHEKKSYLLGFLIFSLGGIILLGGIWLLLLWKPFTRYENTNSSIEPPLITLVVAFIYLTLMSGILCIVINFLPLNVYTIILYCGFIVALIAVLYFFLSIFIIIFILIAVISFSIKIVTLSSIIVISPHFIQEYLLFVGACIILGILIILLEGYIDYNISHKLRIKDTLLRTIRRV